jgi:hypothetical protein
MTRVMSNRTDSPPADDSAIARLLEQLYAVISFEEGGEPNWPAMETLFSEHARITRVTPEGTDYLSPQSFLAMTRNMLELGAYTSFYEFEVARTVRAFGNVAQVWSLYETRRHREATQALGRGINSIQLVREGDAWRVLSLLWDEIHARPDLDFSNHHQQGAV